MNRKQVARVIGILYVVTVLAFLASNLFMKAQLIDAGNIAGTFSLVAGNASRYRFAVALDFVAMVAVMVLVFSLYTVLRPVGPYLALLALGLRIAEVVLQAGAKVPEYLLLTLGQSAASSGANSVELLYLGQALLDASTRALWLSFVFLSVGSLFNNYLFLRSRIIPVALAVYGLFSTALYTIGSLLALLIDLPESVSQGMMLPLVLFELLLGFYLAIFGLKEGALSHRAATADAVSLA